MTTSTTYDAYRTRLETYFDRTAIDAWAQLTSDAPVSRIRATVRAGRDRMRDTLLGWLPQDLSGRRILDAGCGTGALAIEAARRGADVVGVDVAPGLISIACARAPRDLASRLTFLSGDMLSPSLGRFDHVVAMDSLIHYPAAEIAAAAARLAEHTDGSILLTFAPRTPALAVMHTAGKLFPRADRAPAIIPVTEKRIRAALNAIPGWHTARDARIGGGFYTSHAIEMVRG